MLLLPTNNEDIFYDGPSKEYLEQAAEDMAKFLPAFAGIDLPSELLSKLIALGFTGNFFDLGLRPEEALSMDIPTLQRLINEKSGVAAQQEAEREAATREANKKFFENAKTMNRFQL
jgi:hypothetical protein